jgi:hypothetical protein
LLTDKIKPSRTLSYLYFLTDYEIPFIDSTESAVYDHTFFEVKDNHIKFMYNDGILNNCLIYDSKINIMHYNYHDNTENNFEFNYNPTKHIHSVDHLSLLKEKLSSFKRIKKQIRFTQFMILFGECFGLYVFDIGSKPPNVSRTKWEYYRVCYAHICTKFNVKLYWRFFYDSKKSSSYNKYKQIIDNAMADLWIEEGDDRVLMAGDTIKPKDLLLEPTKKEKIIIEDVYKEYDIITEDVIREPMEAIAFEPVRALTLLSCNIEPESAYLPRTLQARIANWNLEDWSISKDQINEVGLNIVDLAPNDKGEKKKNKWIDQRLKLRDKILENMKISVEPGKEVVYYADDVGYERKATQILRKHFSVVKEKVTINKKIEHVKETKKVKKILPSNNPDIWLDNYKKTANYYGVLDIDDEEPSLKDKICNDIKNQNLAAAPSIHIKGSSAMESDLMFRKNIRYNRHTQILNRSLIKSERSKIIREMDEIRDQKKKKTKYRKLKHKLKDTKLPVILNPISYLNNRPMLLMKLQHSIMVFYNKRINLKQCILIASKAIADGYIPKSMLRIRKNRRDFLTQMICSFPHTLDIEDSVYNSITKIESAGYSMRDLIE